MIKQNKTMMNDDYWILAKTFLGQSRERFLMKDPDYIGDIASEIMKADLKFNGNGNLNGYRYQRAVWEKNKILHRHRIKQKKSIPCIFIEDIKQILKPRSIQSIEKKQDLTEDLQYRINSLPDLQRDCIRKYYLEYENLFSIAKTLSIPRSTVYKHIQKGLENLRKIYTQKDIL